MYQYRVYSVLHCLKFEKYFVCIPQQHDLKFLLTLPPARSFKLVSRYKEKSVYRKYKHNEMGMTHFFKICVCAYCEHVKDVRICNILFHNLTPLQ